MRTSFRRLRSETGPSHLGGSCPERSGPLKPDAKWTPREIARLARRRLKAFFCLGGSDDAAAPFYWPPLGGSRPFFSSPAGLLRRRGAPPSPFRPHSFPATSCGRSTIWGRIVGIPTEKGPRAKRKFEISQRDPSKKIYGEAQRGGGERRGGKTRGGSRANPVERNTNKGGGIGGGLLGDTTG